MQHNLYDKLSQKSPVYSQQELEWLLANLGNPEAEIRDGLVYQSFAKAITEHLLSVEQYRYLAKWCDETKPLSKKLAQQGEATLLRSFSALLMTLLVWADGEESSHYYQVLPDQIRQHFFQVALVYLLKESDDTAFHETFGWVHAMAHGADLLSACANHPSFPPSAFPQVLEVLGSLFQNRLRRFVGDEEMRLAPALYGPLISGKIAMQEILVWLDSLDLPLETELDWDRRLSFRLFILTVYAQLDRAKVLDDRQKEDFYPWIIFE